MAKVVPEDKFCGLADEIDVKKSDINDVLNLDLSDPYKPKMEEIKKNVITLEESALTNKKITNSEGAEVAYSKNSFCLLGSNGLEIDMEKTHSDYIIAVLAGTKNSMEREYDYKTKVYFDELGNFEKIGNVRSCLLSIINVIFGVH